MMGSLNPNAIRFDQDKILRELIHASVARRIAFHNPVLNYLTDEKFRYEQERLDTNPQVATGFGVTRRASFETKYTDVDVTRIRESISYTRDQLAKIKNSKLPMSTRVRYVVQKIAESEDRFFFAGDPKFANTGLSNPNNHTAWGSTAFNVTSFALARSTLGAGIGQLIDHYGDSLQKKPLFLVVNPDVYKLMISGSNANTDSGIISILTEELKMHGADTALSSHVFMSKYLGATLDYDGIDVDLSAPGTSNAALIAYDPNYIEVVTSQFDQNPNFIGSDFEITLGESYVPCWKNVNAIIYEDDVTVV